MTLLAAAAWVLALAAAHPAPHTPPHPKASHRPVAVVRAVVVSGTPQTAHAYVAAAAKYYLTEFPAVLTVRIAGPAPRKGVKRRVLFRCVTPGCVFAPVEQPEEGDHKVERVDTSAYDSDIGKDGRAAIRVLLQAQHPTGTYVVEAKPHARKGERAVAVRFTLTTR